MNAVSTNLQTISEKIFDNAEKWLEKNIEYFDLTIKRNTVTEELQFKAFIELLFMMDMFYPQKLFDDKISNKIINLEKKVMNNISFTSYFFSDPTLISGIQEITHFNNYYAVNQANELQHFKNMIHAKIDILAQRTPYRLLDATYSMYKADVKTNLNSRKYYYDLTVLPQKNFNYLYLSDSSAYSITHSLFYITDMGREKPIFLDYTSINKILANMIVFYSCKNNMDIMGESLLSMYFIDKQSVNKDISLSALKLIEKNQSKDGYIYSPRHLEDTNLSEEEIFFENYHTTMVNLGVANVFK